MNRPLRVRLEGVTKEFGNTVAVDNFTATFEDGELVVLLGPSGCGKSTMLNMLSGILPVTKGKIFFDDDDVTDLPPQKRGIGLVFQNYALYPHMTVLENIAFPLEIQNVKKAERVARAKEMAKLVQIEDYLDRRPSQLSGGQQQRVAIARALIKKPRLLLLDEPLSNLDARLRLSTREEIRRIQLETGVTTVFVTHDQEEAMSISDKIILMRLGHLQQVDKPQNLYDDPHNEFVASFIGNPPMNRLDCYIRNGNAVLADGSGEIRLSGDYGLTEGQKVIVGIRPEAIMLNQSTTDFTAKIVQRYTMGKEELAFVSVGNQEIRVYLSNDYEYKKGDDVDIKLRSKGFFLFDKESGERIYEK